MITVRIAVASAVMAALGWIVWKALNDLVGTSLIGQLISVGFAISLAGFVYVRLVLALRIPEARQIEQMVMERLGRAR
jgi:putative peptidoglycan lipid II flippase